ncbi:hypothetical protein VP1G_00423 [Cytospora mali]|uniref:Uncharacterized protein n=1 Tax=Cytospora mali TaxID=578113 RepID=A0A194UMT9_CYTMA|nr:hypothetical protein VP1G_00423 [Valsa mali var. pyri (nom. inval.)]
MPQSTLEQFIRFGTDAAGIERVLRMAQAILMVIISQPLLTNAFVELVSLGNKHLWEEPRVANVGALINIRGQLALARRYFRIFRFLEAFHAAGTLYASLYSPPPTPTPTLVEGQAAEAGPSITPSATTQDEKPPSPSAQPASTPDPTAHAKPQQRRVGAGASQAPAEAWLDIFARAFNGMYLLVETATLVDALGFPLWGPYWFARLTVEGQRFWFLALACGVASGLTKIVKLFAYAPVPPTGEGYGTGDKKAEGDMTDWERERERLRRIMWPRREQRRLWRANIRAKLRGLVRKCVADFLDLAVPGSVVGWVKVDSGTVGVLMVVTTYLTGMDIWERFGNDGVRK